jgi:hypothetical protein
MQYPSGRVISTSFDGAGRPSGVSGVLSGNPTTYASRITYAPQGAVASLPTGEGVSRAFGYNARRQTASVSASNSGGSLLSIGLDYNPTQNNGTLRM